ncbi:MAG: site-specific integrase, partial [Chloroflexi bacterium CFX7]|nr:site-specific integrase [Chloroflexi bacterium CFX7]
ICRQANAHVPEAERIHLTPHMLRHTFLKRVADKHGVHVAQRMSGNVSIREIFRYTKPSEEEMQRTAEELFS